MLVTLSTNDKQAYADGHEVFEELCKTSRALRRMAKRLRNLGYGPESDGLALAIKEIGTVQESLFEHEEIADPVYSDAFRQGAIDAAISYVSPCNGYVHSGN